MAIPLARLGSDPPSGDRSEAERCRPKLFGIAFRMLGDGHEAEDLVQEALLRWQQADRARVREPEAWLVAVVTRLAIDRVRHAAAERARYPGPWLPEPVDLERLSPEYRSELASDLSMAFLVLLERLGPEERAAFVLREVLDADYAEIGAALGKSAIAVRQIVHRARERVRQSRARFAAPPDAKERLLARFIHALETADRDGLLAVLGEGAEWTSDGGAKVYAARKVVRGAERIARMLLGIERKYGQPFTYRLATVNGEPAVIQYHRRREGVFGVTFCETDGERLTALFRVMNPDKLTRVG